MFQRLLNSKYSVDYKSYSLLRIAGVMEVYKEPMRVCEYNYSSPIPLHPAHLCNINAYTLSLMITGVCVCVCVVVCVCVCVCVCVVCVCVREKVCVCVCVIDYLDVNVHEVSFVCSVTIKCCG